MVFHEIQKIYKTSFILQISIPTDEFVKFIYNTEYKNHFTFSKLFIFNILKPT